MLTPPLSLNATHRYWRDATCVAIRRLAYDVMKAGNMLAARIKARGGEWYLSRRRKA